MEESRYIERKISKYVLRAASMYPVVTICGPRQSGKTTLARHLFPDYGYASMENPYTRQAFEADALGFLAAHPAPCIFDEVQNTPELLSYLQGILIMEEGLVPHPIEIKSAQTYNPALYANLLKFAALEPAAAEPTLVYGGEKMGTLQGVRVLSFAQTAQLAGSE